MNLLLELQNLTHLSAGERRMYKLAQRIDACSSENWTTQIAFERPNRPTAVECFYVPTHAFYSITSFEEWEQLRSVVER